MDRPTRDSASPTDDARRVALTRLVSERRPRLVAFVERRVRDRAAAEDLMQETFARALTRVGELRSEEAVAGWFYRALRNAIIDRQRKSGTEERALAAWGAEAERSAPASDEASPRVCRCVARIAASLRPQYVEALQRIEVDDVAVRDFAADRGISQSNAAVRVFRAREALRRGVIATCGACARAGCVDCTCEG